MHRLALEFYRYGPLQQANAHDQAMRSFEINDDAFQIAERSSFDSKALPFLKERPGGHAGTGSRYGLQCVNLLTVDGRGRVSDAHKSNSSRRQQYRQALLRIETAKKIS